MIGGRKEWSKVEKEAASRATLWIIRWQYFLSKLFRSKICASVFMFYIPIISIGYLLQFIYNEEIFTWRMHIALLWLAIAPLLIQSAFEYIIDFFHKYVEVFAHGKWENHFLREIKRIQSNKYQIVGYPLGLALSFLVVHSYYGNAPLAIELWGSISFFLLFFISSIGFHGIFVLITMMNNICCDDLIFEPHHPDRYGGLATFGAFSVKISLYFSSGALVFPLAFEIFSKLGNKADSLNLMIILSSLLFIITMVIGFIAPILRLKQYIDAKKKEVRINYHNKLEKMLKEFVSSENLDIKKAIEIYLFEHLYNSKLNDMRAYPFDLGILSGFGLSFLSPLSIAVLEAFLK